MSPAGVRLVAAQDLRMRVRAGRWRWLLLVWTLGLAGLLALLRNALPAPTRDVGWYAYAPLNSTTTTMSVNGPRGTVMFGALMLTVLALSLLVVPALTCQSVNGDRERGTLATLQVTALSAGDIALGKFLAAWVASLAFLVATAPLIAWCMVEGGVPAVNVAVTVLVLAAIMGSVGAFALALSALLVRPTTSTVFAYLTVAGMCVGTAIAFGLATATVGTAHVTQTVTVPDQGDGTGPQTFTSDEVRTDRTWWLLAPNPFVVLADAAPVTSTRVTVTPGGAVIEEDRLDPLASFGRSVRTLRLSPQDRAGSSSVTFSSNGQALPPQPRGGPVWPTGLVVDVSLGALALGVTRRRLLTPTRKLARGLRIA